MIHELINALALAPAAATTGPSQQISNLQTIINQVEYFYGEGWHTILWEAGLIAGALGVIAPLAIGICGWKNVQKKIKKARKEAHDETEDAKKQIAEARKEASETINRQQKELTTLVQAETMKAKHFATGGTPPTRTLSSRCLGRRRDHQALAPERSSAAQRKICPCRETMGESDSAPLYYKR